MGEPLANPTPARYRELVDALVYLTISRYDIAYAVHIVNRYVQALISVHYDVLRIIQYMSFVSSDICTESLPGRSFVPLHLLWSSEHILILSVLEISLPIILLLYCVSFLGISSFLGEQRSRTWFSNPALKPTIEPYPPLLQRLFVQCPRFSYPCIPVFK